MTIAPDPMRGLPQPLLSTAPEGTPDPYIAMVAESNRVLAQQVLGWLLDDLRVTANMVAVEGTPDFDALPGVGRVMLMCPRPCAPYPHGHIVKDRSL